MPALGRNLLALTLAEGIRDNGNETRGLYAYLYDEDGNLLGEASNVSHLLCDVLNELDQFDLHSPDAGGCVPVEMCEVCRAEVRQS